MARIAAAALAVIPIGAGAGRPKPPARLSAPEKRLWIGIVASKPIGWFDATTIPLLAEYCSTISSCDAVTAQLRTEQRTKKLDDDALKRIDRLFKMRERQQRQALQLATRMRLTQQAGKIAASPGAKGHVDPPGVRKPWEE